ncbi:MAG: trehalose-6-phosphate synthase [Acidobacteria bacterium]|nr:trehalose-6-phosphate synthase [Acidobacteriota bacterium]
MTSLAKLLAMQVLAGSGELVRVASAAIVGTAVAIDCLARGPGRSRGAALKPWDEGLIEQAPARDASEGTGDEPWTEASLRAAIDAHLTGRQIIVVSNREPCVHELQPDGTVVARRPVGGVVTALHPVARACSGVWVAHGSGSADRITADRAGRVRIATGHCSYLLGRVWLTPEEERGYYHGFANEGLWPLCHLVSAAPVFRRNDWAHYERVNRRFTDTVVAQAQSPDPVVLVQDYHLALVPRMLRRRLPHATILTFWHIPWPSAERFAICPYGEELLDGLLGSSIVGFQTPRHRDNFVAAVEHTLEARPRGEDRAIVHRGGPTLVRSYPISIEWPNHWASGVGTIETCRRTVRAELGIGSRTHLVVSVDRLDYTKGIEERLTAIERLLGRGLYTRGRMVFLQIAAPSRMFIQRYRDLAERVRARVETINTRYGRQDSTPVVYVDRYVEPAEVFRFYRAADVCYVGSLDDGMNLVAKEFVAARDDEQGVLLLSRFAGAALDLTEALIVNPYDVDGVADALADALSMPVAEQRRRMRAMRAQVAGHNVYEWAGRMLVDAARLRAGSRQTAVVS